MGYDIRNRSTDVPIRLRRKHLTALMGSVLAMAVIVPASSGCGASASTGTTNAPQSSGTSTTSAPKRSHRVRHRRHRSVPTHAQTTTAGSTTTTATTLPPTTAPPPTTTTAPTPAGCSPKTDSGNCYEPGEYCRDSDHGVSGVAGDGEHITCADNNGWRWEPS
jgi:hypothetical protein